MAVGEVAFSGKIVKGCQGWRAEKGRILNLVVPYEFWGWVEPLGLAYNVPVEMGFLFADDDRQKVLEREARNTVRNGLLDAERRRLDDIANRKEDD